VEFAINIVACASSTAMEADIIVEGFKQSVSIHNLIYSQLIGKKTKLN
jgi:hypothetical protein